MSEAKQGQKCFSRKDKDWRR